MSRILLVVLFVAGLVTPAFADIIPPGVPPEPDSFATMRVVVVLIALAVFALVVAVSRQLNSSQKR